MRWSIARPNKLSPGMWESESIAGGYDVPGVLEYSSPTGVVPGLDVSSSREVSQRESLDSGWSIVCLNVGIWLEYSSPRISILNVHAQSESGG